MTFRWFLGLCIVKNRVIGRVYQLPSSSDQTAKGSVQKQAPWAGVGMKLDWDDTSIGTHDSRDMAVQAVQTWYWAQVKSMPCSSHGQWRKDCIPCQELVK